LSFIPSFSLLQFLPICKDTVHPVQLKITKHMRVPSY
jgi:hypothetical protein